MVASHQPPIEATRQPFPGPRLARRVVARARRDARRVLRRLRRPADARFVRGAYRAVLRREPDPDGLRNSLTHLAQGTRTRDGVLDDLVSSDEFRFGIHYLNHLVSLHVSRCQFVRSLPRAARILDLGGASQNDPSGALVMMGYPYRFEELMIVDLPFEDRHDLYANSAPLEHFDSRLGPVRYLYQSMTDFSAFADASVDLVYSGQTIEHVTPDECRVVLEGVRRVLRPGGWFALDTPNGPVCRLHQPEFINPDHRVEYSHEEMLEHFGAAGLELVGAWGLNWVGESVRTGAFSLDELRRNVGVYHEAQECYLLAYLCRKPV